MSANAAREWAAQANANAVRFAHEILRTLIVVHGGATIAMLSFISGVLGDSKVADGATPLLVRPLMCFGWGIVITLAAMVGAYFTEGLTTSHAQEMDYSGEHPNETQRNTIKKIERRKLGVHVIAVLLTLASVGAFLVGMYQLKAGMQEALRPEVKAVKPAIQCRPVTCVAANEKESSTTAASDPHANPAPDAPYAGQEK